MNIRIRRETSADIRAIETLTAAAFRDAPHTSHTEHFIVNALREAGKLTVSLVAQENAEIVGHVAVSPVAISDGSNDWFGVGPVSVSPERQRQGIGSRLMEQCAGRVAQTECQWLRCPGISTVLQPFRFQDASESCSARHAPGVLSCGIIWN